MPVSHHVLDDWRSAKWLKWQADVTIDRDREGVVAGEEGHERLWLPIKQDRFVDTFDSKTNDHVQSSKAYNRNRPLQGCFILEEMSFSIEIISKHLRTPVDCFKIVSRLFRYRVRYYSGPPLLFR